MKGFAWCTVMISSLPAFKSKVALDGLREFCKGIVRGVETEDFGISPDGMRDHLIETLTLKPHPSEDHRAAFQDWLNSTTSDDTALENESPGFAAEIDCHKTIGLSMPSKLSLVRTATPEPNVGTLSV